MPIGDIERRNGLKSRLKTIDQVSWSRPEGVNDPVFGRDAPCGFSLSDLMH